MPAPLSWLIRGRALLLDRPIVMGILNVTPDSFSDGGRYVTVDAAVERARTMLAEGADIIDVGAESTRPQGAQSVAQDEELRRLVPVIRALVATLPDVVLSVDTVKSEVAAAALDAGASIVNDVSAMRLDPHMADVVVRTGAGVVLMHSRGGVHDMATYTHADYDGDVLDIVERELVAQVGTARNAGVAAESIVIDPGVGFSKRPEDSLRVLGGVERLARLGYPVMIGASRKRFIGSISGVLDAAGRVHGSVGAAVAAYDRGASIFRVHDVAATRQALDVAAAIRHAAATAPVHA